VNPLFPSKRLKETGKLEYIMGALAPGSHSKVQASAGSVRASLRQHKLAPVAKNTRKNKETPAPSKLSASAPPPLSEDGD
jgi:hypothetical protein